VDPAGGQATGTEHCHGSYETSDAARSWSAGSAARPRAFPRARLRLSCCGQFQSNAVTSTECGVAGAHARLWTVRIGFESRHSSPSTGRPHAHRRSRPQPSPVENREQRPSQSHWQIWRVHVTTIRRLLPTRCDQVTAAHPEPWCAPPSPKASLVLPIGTRSMCLRQGRCERLRVRKRERCFDSAMLPTAALGQAGRSSGEGAAGPAPNATTLRGCYCRFFFNCRRTGERRPGDI
jgi:hypothetical protein